MICRPPAILAASLLALAACSADQPAAPSSSPRPNATPSPAPAEERQDSVTVMALRGIPTAIALPPGGSIAAPPEHGVLGSETDGSCTYRSANGWWGFDRLTVLAPGRRTIITIDVDRHAGLPELVSGARSRSDAHGFSACDSDGASSAPAVSGNGRRVAFASAARNLTADTTPGIYLVDRSALRQDGSLTRIAALGDEPVRNEDPLDEAVDDADGSLVALDGAGTTVAHVARHDGRRTIAITTVTPAGSEPITNACDGSAPDGDSGAPALDAAGRLVVFHSSASNLVADDTNDVRDVFLYDRSTRRTRRLSTGSDGVDGDGPSGCPVLSADGRWAAFHSAATNLVAGDGNHRTDVFVYSLGTGLAERASIPNGGAGEADGVSAFPSLSADGRYVAFQSWAGNLVDDDTNRCCDVFVRDRRNGTTVRISRMSDGGDADGPSFRPVISADGRFVVFLSAATNLVPGPAGSHLHAYRHDRLTGATRRIDQGLDGHLPAADCTGLRLDASGAVPVFSSAALQLVPETIGTGFGNIYAMPLPAGVIN